MTFFYRLCTLLVCTFLAYAPLSAQNAPCIGLHCMNDGVSLRISGLSPILPPVQGLFPYCDYSLPFNSAYVFSLYKNDDPLNGVNSFDLLLIQKHLLGVKPIVNPLGIIAADANKSNSDTLMSSCLAYKLSVYQDHLPDSVKVIFLNANSMSTILELPECFDLPTPAGQPSTTKGTLEANWDYDEGVNSYDLYLMSQHLLALQPLSSPYRMIAADINKSGSITPTDITEGRKLILGQYPQGLPNNNSWRFFNAAYVFPNPFNPFSNTFPEIINFVGSQDTVLVVPVKVGDMDGSDLPSGEDFTFAVQDQMVQLGEEIIIPLRVKPLLAFQGTFTFDGLKYVSIESASSTDYVFNFFHEQENALAVSVFGWDMSTDLLFTIRVRALKTGKLSDMFGFTDVITPRLGMQANLVPVVPRVEFFTMTNTATFAASTLKFSAQPSVFSEKTTLHLQGNVKADEKIQIVAYNSLGQIVFVKNAASSPNGWSLEVFAEDVPSGGAYTFVAQVGQQKAVVRAVRM